MQENMVSSLPAAQWVSFKGKNEECLQPGGESTFVGKGQVQWHQNLLEGGRGA